MATRPAHQSKPQAALIAANTGTKGRAQSGHSAGHLAGSIALLLFAGLFALLATLAGPYGNGQGILAAVAGIAGFSGGLWFAYGVYAFAANIDHIARKV